MPRPTRGVVRAIFCGTLVVSALLLWPTWLERFSDVAPVIFEEPFWTEADSTLTGDELSNIEIYNRASPATVHITSTVLQRNWFLEVYPSESTGSGFLIDADGRILTNFHVIQGSAELEVNPLAEDDDGNSYKATVLATDPANDLALIQIRPEAPMPFLALGDSDGVKVGQKVLAIGNPFGLEGTLTTGVISSTGRSIQDRSGVLKDLIQTDAAINPGNSGGPLLDSSGNVIGVNTAIYGPSGNIGIGFAMPINRAKALLRFVKGGAQPPQDMGVEGLFLTRRWSRALRLPTTLSRHGCRQGVRGCCGRRARGQPGDHRGQLPRAVGGDVIIEIDGAAVTNRSTMQQALSLKLAGDTVSLRVLRDGEELELTLTYAAATLACAL